MKSVSEQLNSRQIPVGMAKKENPFSVETPEESSGFLLWQVTNLWQREIRKALEKHDLTHSQFVLLASIHWLTLHGADVTQILLSSHTKIDPMTTSTVLRTLERKGLVKRVAHTTDTRAKSIALTPAGKRSVTAAVVTVETFDQTFFSVLKNDTQAFNHHLIRILSKTKSS